MLELSVSVVDNNVSFVVVNKVGTIVGALYIVNLKLFYIQSFYQRKIVYMS